MTNRARCRIRLSLGLLFLVSAIVFAPDSLVQGQTGTPAPREQVLSPYRIVNITALPPAAPQAPTVPVQIPFLVPDPNLLQQLKSRPIPGPTPLQPSGGGPKVLDGIIGITEEGQPRCGGIAPCVAPPDTQVAAGPMLVLEAVNTALEVVDRVGNVVLQPVDLHTFFNVDPSILIADPKVRFDPASGRWFIVAITTSGAPGPSGVWLLAVSTTSDPTGSYVGYILSSASGTFPDFPSIGFNDDKVVLTGDAFDVQTESFFFGTEYWVLNKAQIGGTVSTVFAPPDQGLFGIRAAHSLSSTSTLFMAAVNVGSVSSMRVWSLTGVPGVGGGVSVSTVDIPISTLSPPPRAQQAGTTSTINTQSNNLLDGVYRNGALWVTANDACVPPGDATTHACMRFIQILTSTMTNNQDFDFGQAGIDYYFAAIQIVPDPNPSVGGDDLIAVFNESSPSDFPSVFASGRREALDPPNTLESPTLLQGGQASYVEFNGRWGDYSGAGFDPSTSGAVWVAGEYSLVDGSWSTAIAQVSF